MSVTTFTVVGGQMMRQVKDGVVHDFVPDPLGSVVMVQDSAGAAVYKAEYDPYGNVQSETGTNPSSLGYVGTLGYIKDSATSMYVRARYLLSNLGRWLSKDPLWPSEPGYVYGGAAPNMRVDPSGLLACATDPVFVDCPQAHPIRNAFIMYLGRIQKFCKDSTLKQKFKDCMLGKGYRGSDVDSLMECYCRFVTGNKPEIHCVDQNECTKANEDCLFTRRGDANSKKCVIRFCPACTLSIRDLARGISHEAFHCCGTSHDKNAKIRPEDTDDCLRAAIGWGWGP